MSNQKQLNLGVNKDRLTSLTFTEPVKVGSAELDQLITDIAIDAENRRSSGSEARPYYAIDLIRRTRLGALRLPVELGVAVLVFVNFSMSSFD